MESAQKVGLMLRQAQHEQKIINDFHTCPVRPEPFDFAQDRLVEG
jgi:hypothetical protein